MKIINLNFHSNLPAGELNIYGHIQGLEQDYLLMHVVAM